MIKKSRLKKKLEKYAGERYDILNSFVLKSGDVIELQVSVTSNRPWFQILHHHQYNVSSYYDGDDFQRALKYYDELLMAFCGVKAVEDFHKQMSIYETKINNLIVHKKNDYYEDLYNNISKKPLFLGNNDF